MAAIMNEQIKATEIELLDIDGNLIGFVETSKALQLAKDKKADLVCLNMMKSPPLCGLIARGKAKEVLLKQQEPKAKKLKEIRLTPTIEQHDLETKINQCIKLLESGHSVYLVIKLTGKQGPAAKGLLEEINSELKGIGKPTTGIQISGKQAALTIAPI